MPKRTNPLSHLVSALRDLATWLKKEKIPGIVIGGVAVSLLSRPRVTRDIDAVVLLDAKMWGAFLASGKSFGFKPRMSDALDFAKRSRVLLLEHESSGIQVDISLGALPFEIESIRRQKKIKVSNFIVPVATPEDLIIMKVVAHRPRDLADVGMILEVTPQVDTKRISKWVKEFSKALEMPELVEDLKKLLKKGRLNK